MRIQVERDAGSVKNMVVVEECRHTVDFGTDSELFRWIETEELFDICHFFVTERDTVGRAGVGLPAAEADDGADVDEGWFASNGPRC